MANYNVMVSPTPKLFKNIFKLFNVRFSWKHFDNNDNNISLYQKFRYEMYHILILFKLKTLSLHEHASHSLLKLKFKESAIKYFIHNIWDSFLFSSNSALFVPLCFILRFPDRFSNGQRFYIQCLNTKKQQKNEIKNRCLSGRGLHL